MRATSRSVAWVSRLVVLGILLSAFGLAVDVVATTGVRSAAAQQDDPTQATTLTVNVQLILDASGSMAEDAGGGETRMEAAKRVLHDVIEAIPEREGINVGFRVYGHEGDNTEAGRAESCQSSELLVPMQGVNKELLHEQVDRFEPTGWTPLALSLERAGGDFQPGGESITNAIVMVTDGLETCGGDPCAVARSLREAEIEVTTHVVGFGLTQDEQQTVACIAEEGGGLNLTAGTAQELSTALFTILEQLEVVVQTGYFEIEAFGDIFPRCTITGHTAPTDAAPEGEEVSITLSDSNRVELNVGRYDVSWINPSGEETRIQVNIESGRTTWVRGSLLKFPQGAGEIYTVRDLAGVVVWQDQFEQGAFVWVLPGIYRMELLERVGNPILIMAEVQTLPGTVTQVEVFTAGS